LEAVLVGFNSNRDWLLSNGGSQGVEIALSNISVVLVGKDGLGLLVVAGSVFSSVWVFGFGFNSVL
jgi:hypothetical protein